MKNTLLLLLLSSIGLIQTNAQISYESSDFLSNGDSLRFSTMTLGLSSFDFDTTGANISWDFSGLTYEDQEIKKYFAPENGGYRTNWCTSNGYVLNCISNFDALTNKAIQTFDQATLGNLQLENGVMHASLKNNVFTHQMLGRTATIEGLPVKLTTEFEQADTLFQFPFTMSSTDSSISRMVTDFSPAPIVQSKNNKRVNMIEGHGSLKTPYGDFPDVLKMKTVLTRNDTTFTNGNPVPVNLIEVEYSWWSKSYGLPVLTANGNRIGNLTTITQVTYLDSSRCVNPRSLFTFSPASPILEPGSKTVQVQFTDRSNNADSLVWLFADGSTSNLQNPSFTFDSAGTYLIKLMAYNTCNPLKTLADTTSLPVIVIDTTCLTPKALFTYSPISPVLDPNTNNTEVKFSSKSTNADSLIWEFSDGSKSNVDSAFFTYTESGNFPVKLTVFSTSCSSGLLSDTLTLNVLVRDSSINVGSTTQQKNTLKTYPNPSSAIVKISGHNDKSWELFSVDGRKILSGTTAILSVEHLSEGVYVLKVGRRSVKLTVKK